MDNLLEMDVVIADGKLVTANNCSNADLFWALRGGGGGTFGVVTRAVYKAHDPAPNYFKVGGTIIGNCTDCAKKIMGAYVDWMNYTEHFQPGMWAGYPSWGPYGEYTVLSLFLCYFGPESEAM